MGRVLAASPRRVSRQILSRIGTKVIFHIGDHACYGWRILFFIGGLPALLAIFIRMGIKESEVWEKTKHADWGTLSRAIVSHWPLMLGMIVFTTVMMCSSHGTQDLYPTFLEKDFNFSAKGRAILTAITAVGAILGGVAFGLWSDRIGRRRAMIAAFVLSILVIPLWACYPPQIVGTPTIAKLVIGGFLIQFGVQGAWGIVPAYISELSPDSVRGFVPGFAYQMGALCSGFLPWLQDHLHPAHGYGKVLAPCALIVFLSAITIISFSKEKRGIIFGEHP